MSVIYNTLRNSKYDTKIIMPEHLINKHLIVENKKIFAVVGVLGCGDSITSFYKNSHFKNTS